MEMKEKLFKLGEDVKNSAGKLAKGAIDGSKKVAEKVKIKNTISQAESRLNAVYIEIGKKYEEIYGDKGNPEFAELLAEIADARTQIALSRAELAAVDSAAICDGCGKYVQEGQRFCPYCGAKLIKDVTPEVIAEAEQVTEDTVSDAE